MRPLMRTRRTIIGALCVLAAALAMAGGIDKEPDISGERNFLSGYPAINDDGTVNVVIECPAGTTAKWVVDPDGVLRRKYDGDTPRSYQYLPFPANYGMVPGTLLAHEIGGDGEPLDALVLGSAVPRGTVIRTRVIGVLALLEAGEQDDKMVTVPVGSVFDGVNDIEELDRQFPGVTSILETWFLNAKGQNVFQSYGFLGSSAANRLLQATSSAYQRATAEES
jgi:inorganic pyrophosphatase